MPREDAPESDRSGPVRVYADLTTRWWWAFLLLVGAGLWAVTTQLPSLESASGGGGLSFISEDAPAVAAQVRAVRLFGLPLLTRVAVVQHDPAGLAPDVVTRAVDRARAIDEPAIRGQPRPPLLLALPVVNGIPASLPSQILPDSAALGRAFSTPLRVPAALGGGTPTTIVTYLFVAPTTNPFEQERIAQDYAAGFDRSADHVSGVSGVVPFQLEQGQVVNDHLREVELASVLAVTLVVALVFRSLIAPFVTLATAGASYLVADHLVGEAAQLAGISAPGQLEPVLVALALGVSTDYSILFLSGMQRRLRLGDPDREAARGAVEDYLSIVLVAGLTVTAGVAALSVARTSVFQAFGPGLALSVVSSLVVSVLLVPALLALLGRRIFWPGSRWWKTKETETPGGRSRFIGLMTRRTGVAATTVGIAVVLLGLGAAPLAGLRESVSPMDALPPGNPVRAAWEDAAAGFAPGILSPTEFIVSAPGITDRRDRLVALERALTVQPGVAGVIGPGSAEIPPQARLPFSVFAGPRGDTARILVVFDADPVGAQAIVDLRNLQQRLPALLAGAGLGGASVETAGDTALGLGFVDSARGDLVRVALVVAAVVLLLLVLFLRAIVAPLYLLVCSALVVGASLGVTSLVFGHLGQGGLIFFVPFAAGALLASLGSDYAVFGIGDVWQVARTRPLGEALAVAVPRSNRAISAAGITLAASFGFVALVPLASFRELAFAMTLGVLLDTFLVRGFLVPALIWWVGPASAWPGHRLRRDPGSSP